MAAAIIKIKQRKIAKNLLFNSKLKPSLTKVNKKEPKPNIAKITLEPSPKGIPLNCIEYMYKKKQTYMIILKKVVL